MDGQEKKKQPETEKLIQAETAETGRVNAVLFIMYHCPVSLLCPPDCRVSSDQVKSKVYLEYVKAVGPALSVFICFLYGCQSAAAIGANIWLSQWTNDASRNQTQENVQMRVGVYAALGIAQGKEAGNRK